mgnify:FL=1|tara:strand:+ start:885 stop:1013 length:129 start_codon:yes stop_codon:yes gene_type:complete
MENDYLIECEECDNTCKVTAYDWPEYCPICGALTEPVAFEDE